jgi:hypothetical protein
MRLCIYTYTQKYMYTCKCKRVYIYAGSPDEYYYGNAYDLAWNRVDKMSVDSSGRFLTQSRDVQPSIPGTRSTTLHFRRNV